jgi:hypothetical protein
VTSVAAHEASHCAGLLAQGLPVRFARTDLWVDAGSDLAGAVGLDLDDLPPTTSAIKALLIATLLGATESGQEFRWPLHRTRWRPGLEGDGQMIMLLSSRLELDRVAFHHLLHQSVQLANSHRFRALLVAIRDALEQREYLTRDELEQIAQGILE